MDITEVHRLAGDSGGGPNKDVLSRRSGDARPVPELALVMVVRELGPRLVIGLPVLDDVPSDAWSLSDVWPCCPVDGGSGSDGMRSDRRPSGRLGRA